MNNRRILIANVAQPSDQRRVVIANLAKGQIGERAANLLGSLPVSHFQLIIMARSELTPEKQATFFAHVDEFANFATNDFASSLSEAGVT
jgi:hypothetical protein